MRLADKEIKDRGSIESVITKATVCRIGLCENNTPYVVPVIFGYKENCLYFHSARKGKKIDILKQNSNVCFEMDIDHELTKAESPCDWDMKYRSVIGFGKASFVDDLEEKRKVLNTILEHYSGGNSHEYPEKLLSYTLIIKIEIESITGKQSGY